MGSAVGWGAVGMRVSLARALTALGGNNSVKAFSWNLTTVEAQTPQVPRSNVVARHSALGDIHQPT